jgi:hypothetical protein
MDASEVRKRLRAYRHSGWQVEHQRRTGWRLTHPDAPRPLFLHDTPSDRRTFDNFEAKMRRMLRKEG